jgi:tetratricopeptide (TPR) repeat protein
MGDGIMALFGAPLAHEDHAVRACYAALRMQEAVRRYTEDLRAAHGVEVQIRVGLNSGEVVVRSIGSDLRMDYSAVGQTTHLAARLEQLATPGTIRLSSSTLDLAEGYVAARSIGPVPVKGLAQPIEVFELTGAGTARTRLQVARDRGLTRFVGRDMEMEQLRRAAEDARVGRGQVVAVVGEPGVGKSRLYFEFLRSHHAQGFLILESGSASYGKATPFLPLADLLRSYFRIDARDDVRGIRVKVTGGLLTLDESLRDAVPVALWLLDAVPEDSPFLALEPAERRRQTFAAVKRILLRENDIRPLLLVFEDLHWIDGETQAFLDAFVESVPAARVLLATNYRPEYRHGWASKTYYRQLRVDPLPPQRAEDLLAELLGADPSVESLKPMLIARSEGKPLFLEESVRMLVETGALVGERGAYRVVRAPEALQVPATVQAILASRIDRLEPEDKRLLQAAAVVGTHVPFAVLRAIVDGQEDDLRTGLARLQTAEFLYEARLFPELEYAFKHALTHEVAYGGVLQDRRHQLHRATVEAIEHIYADRLAEQIERLAYHAVNGRVPQKAARYLREAGAKAFGRSASQEARAYFEQALALLRDLPPSPDTLREELETLITCGPALMELKSPAAPEVEALYRRALDLVEQLGIESRRFPALWGLWYMNYNRGQDLVALEAGERLLEIARQGDDSGLLLEAYDALWPTLTSIGRPLQAIPHAEQGVAIYDRERHSGYTHLYAGHDPGACCRYHLAMLHWITGYPERARRELEEAFRLAESLKHPLTLVIALWFGAWVRLQRGERDIAFAMCEQLIEIARPRGFARWLEDIETVHYVARMERLDAEVLAECERRLATLRSASWRQMFCRFSVAEICGRQGFTAEGTRILFAIPESKRRTFCASEFLRVEGELLLSEHTPDSDGAEHRFRSAIEIARGRGEKSFELRAATSLARLLARDGRREEARDALAGIYGWFSEGFNTADLKSARGLLEELGAR